MDDVNVITLEIFLKHRKFIQDLADYVMDDDDLRGIEWAEGNFARVIREARKFLKDNPIDD